MVIGITAEDFLVIEEVLLACLPPDGASATHLKTGSPAMLLKCDDKVWR